MKCGVPMIALCLLLCGCRAGETSLAADLREPYHDMAGCTMEAVVSCEQDGRVWEAELKCDYVPDGRCRVEVLAPETIAGVAAILEDGSRMLQYEGTVLNAGVLSSQELSPAVCLPRLMSALRDGWLLEENEETWEGVDCLRLTVDQSGLRDGKILSTVWLRMDNGAPLRGEIAVEDEIILTAEFTSFTFCDTIAESSSSGA